MIRFVSALIVVGFVLIGFSYYRSVSKQERTEQVFMPNSERLLHRGYFLLQSHPKASVVAELESFQVFQSALELDKAWSSFQDEKNELLIVEIINQYLATNKTIEKIEFFFSQPNRPLKEIFNQYGVLGVDLENIHFSDVKNDIYASVNGKTIKKVDFRALSYHWGALETKIFDRSLQVVKEKVEKHFLTHWAREKAMSTEEFVEKVVLKEYQDLNGVEKQKKLSKELANSLLPLPVKLYLKEPQFPVEFKPDWTPQLGPTESAKELLIFTDFYSEYSKVFFSQIEKLSELFPDVRFGFRPVFPPQNQYQKMLAEMSFCVWDKQPKMYWNFIKKAAIVQPKSFEKDLYKIIGDLKMDLPAMKQCFYKQEFKKVVQYHLDYAQYLQITSGPVIFVDGRVYTGGLGLEKIQQIVGDL